MADTEYVVTFGVMLAIALLISTLTARLKAQVESGRLRERRITALYELGKQLSSISGATFLTAAAARKVAELTGGEVVIYLGEPGRQTRGRVRSEIRASPCTRSATRRPAG